MKLLKLAGILVLIIILIYFLGPKPGVPKYSIHLPELPSTAAKLEQYVTEKENSLQLKPDNEARIIWSD